MQLAACQGRLEHVARVQAAFTCARAHDRVQLVDEQDDLAVGFAHLAQDGLQAVLELAAVLRAGHERPHVERHDLAIAQGGRHVAVDDALRQPLDDGRLAHARLADEHGVVLRAARKHLDGVANLVVAPDDGVELALARGLGQVLAVLRQGLELRLALAVGHARVAAQLVVDLLDALFGDAGHGQELARVAFVARKRDEQMLSRREGVAHFLGTLHGGVHHVGQRIAGTRHVARAAHLRGSLDGAVHLGRQHRRVRADALDDGVQVALVRVKQRLQQVHGFDLGRLGIGCDGHGVLQSLLGRYCQFVYSHVNHPFYIQLSSCGSPKQFHPACLARCSCLFAGCPAERRAFVSW